MITIFYENYVDNITLQRVTQNIQTSASYIKGVFRNCNIAISEVKNNICFKLKLNTGTMLKFVVY